MSWIKRLFGKKSPPRYVEFHSEWRVILLEKVEYYSILEKNEKARFEKSVLRFLNTTKITGIKTDVGHEDIVLIGASAIIPIFAFPSWEYHNLQEVLVYPEHFN
jgi:Mlc titration factor MtfA (ptsG expression regulator)